MTARRGAVAHVERLAHSGRVYGQARRVVPVLKAVGVPWMFDPRRTAYTVPLDALPDVEAALESAGVKVQAVGGELW